MTNPISRALNQRRYAKLRRQYDFTQLPKRYRDFCITFPVSPSMPLQPDEAFIFTLHGILSAEVSEKRDYAFQLLYPQNEIAQRYAAALKGQKDDIMNLYRMSCESQAELDNSWRDARMHSILEELSPTLNSALKTLKEELVPRYNSLKQEVARKADAPFKERHAGFRLGNDTMED